MTDDEDRILKIIKNNNFICFCGEIANKNFGNKFNIKIECIKCNYTLINKIEKCIYINLYHDANNNLYGFAITEYKTHDLDLCLELEEIINIIEIGNFAKIREKYDKYLLFI